MTCKMEHSYTHHVVTEQEGDANKLRHYYLLQRRWQHCNKMCVHTFVAAHMPMSANDNKSPNDASLNWYKVLCSNMVQHNGENRFGKNRKQYILLLRRGTDGSCIDFNYLIEREYRCSITYPQICRQACNILLSRIFVLLCQIQGNNWNSLKNNWPQYKGYITFHIRRISYTFITDLSCLTFPVMTIR